MGPRRGIGKEQEESTDFPGVRGIRIWNRLPSKLMSPPSIEESKEKTGR